MASRKETTNSLASPSIVKFWRLWSNIPHRIRFFHNFDSLKRLYIQIDWWYRVFSFSLLNIASTLDLVLKTVGCSIPLVGRLPSTERFDIYRCISLHKFIVCQINGSCRRFGLIIWKSVRIKNMLLHSSQEQLEKFHIMVRQQVRYGFQTTRSLSLSLFNNIAFLSFGSTMDKLYKEAHLPSGAPLIIYGFFDDVRGWWNQRMYTNQHIYITT